MLLKNTNIPSLFYHFLTPITIKQAIFLTFITFIFLRLFKVLLCFQTEFIFYKHLFCIVLDMLKKTKIKKTKRPLLKGFFTLIVIAIFCVFYAFFIEPFRLVTHTHQLGEEKSSEKIKVVQISDLHIGEHFTPSRLDKLIEEIDKIKPDILVFTGDLYDNYAIYNEDLLVSEKLSQLSAPLGKYAVWGNRDYGGGAQKAYGEIMENAGFTLLVEEGDIVTLPNKKQVYIYGMDDSLLGSGSPTTYAQKKQCDYEILLTHEPDIIDSLQVDRFDLVLAGHSHGGQAKLPGITLSRTKMAQTYTDGLYQIGKGNSALYVNTGIGTTKIHARFLLPPEIAVFEIAIA